MGCKCCKMIKSYIFHPQDMQTTAYINEINNYKLDEEGRGRFHSKQNSDILSRRNEVQIAETPVVVNQIGFHHHSKDALWSSRTPAVPEKGRGISVVKCNVNGVHSSKNLGAPSHQTQPKEINLHSSSAQLPDKRVFQPKTDDKLEMFNSENHPKQTLDALNAFGKEEGSQTIAEPIFPISCSLPEFRHKDLRLDNPSFLPEDNPAEIPRAIGKENFSNHLVQINQSAENTTLVHHQNSLHGESDEGDGFWRMSHFILSFEDQIATEISSRNKKVEPVWEARCDGLVEVNGELEEDAEVAEALAALEAATAGEMFEEEEEEDYY
ncbi:uncharacterized protein C4orf19 homolog [Erythrolamprus reginae]|uniref:uncharacterized protein C4orf19 homolog n=1 Tax=Erythrolamprus reginae TaxID=121349 RepID=UPI00396C5D2F